MKIFKYRKNNVKVNAIYSKYMKVDIGDKIDNVSFDKALENCYREIKKGNDAKEYKSFLIYRYNYLRNEFSNILTLIFIVATTCIPAICLSVFNTELFDGIDNTQLIISILFAFAVILGLIIVASLFSSILIAPWVLWIFSKKSIELQNTEIRIISDYLHKMNFVEYISRKESLKKALFEGVLTLLISVVVWILICLKV